MELEYQNFIGSPLFTDRGAALEAFWLPTSLQRKNRTAMPSFSLNMAWASEHLPVDEHRLFLHLQDAQDGSLARYVWDAMQAMTSFLQAILPLSFDAIAGHDLTPQISRPPPYPELAYALFCCACEALARLITAQRWIQVYNGILSKYFQAAIVLLERTPWLTPPHQQDQPLDHSYDLLMHIACAKSCLLQCVLHNNAHISSAMVQLRDMGINLVLSAHARREFQVILC